MRVSPIIEVEELLKIRKNSDLIIFDVSNNKDAKNNYNKVHLEGAFFVDLNTQLSNIKNEFSDGGRHPLPDLVKFAQTLTNLGITKDSHIVLYDDKNGSNAAARFWWMLKSIKHQKVQVLNGGFNRAKEKDFPLSSKVEVVKVAPELYKIGQWYLPTIDMNGLESVLQNPNYLIVDVREQDRYNGKTEPIDLISGHIPSAINIPFTENLYPNEMFLKVDEIRKKYESFFTNVKAKNVIIHCGSGVTACHTLLALDYAEMEIPMLYVGSWSEWSRNNKPIEITIV